MAEEERRRLADGPWTDFPERPNQATWCHGAPGIALSRLSVYGRHKAPGILTDARRALEFTLENPIQGNHGLCHGALGNLEALRLAADTLPDEPNWSRGFASQAQAILSEISNLGFRSPLPTDLIEPGLMTGLSGMGLELLRLAAPDRIPSVLTLQPPRH